MATFTLKSYPAENADGAAEGIAVHITETGPVGKTTFEATKLDDVRQHMRLYRERVAAATTTVAAITVFVSQGRKPRGFDAEFSGFKRVDPAETLSLDDMEDIAVEDRRKSEAARDARRVGA